MTKMWIAFAVAFILSAKSSDTILIHYPGGLLKEVCLDIRTEEKELHTCWEPRQVALEQVKMPPKTLTVKGTLKWRSDKEGEKVSYTPELRLRPEPDDSSKLLKWLKGKK